jgi:uncharacterized protein YdhG (YjbR/CyaY superfamily)
MKSAKPTTIDEYVRQFPTETQELLQVVRNTIRRTAPKAEEGISYGIPAFFLHGKYLIYFAGYKHHIGLYPVPNGNPTLEKLYKPFKTSGKGTIQFPLDRKLPVSLIARIVKFRAAWNLAHKKTQAKKASVKKVRKK